MGELMQTAPPLDYYGPINVPYTPLPPDYLDVPLFTLFAHQARQRPDKIAIWDDQGGYTYDALYRHACHIAQALGPSVGKEQQPIGLWLENDKRFIAGMLAALAVGRPYVGLDITLPVSQNRTIIEQAKITDLITVSAHKVAVSEQNASVMYLDELRHPDACSPFQPTASPTSLAYIIYTSGTTGTPKGVFQNQRNLLHDVSQYIDSIHLSANDRLSLFYSPTVNGAIRDIYGSLLTGATLYIRNVRQHGLASLAAFITQHQLTVYHSVPSIFRACLQAADQQSFPSVRLVYLAGDRIISQDVDRYKRHFLPASFLYIGIGSTENATIYRQWFIGHDTRTDEELLPVGYAVPDRTMQLRSSDGSLTPPGEAGEIIVDSPYMALGYWQNPSLTQAAFAQTSGGRQFRTGDLGRMRPDGLLEFIGRQDRQLKVAGHRVEPASLEAILRQAPSIDDVAIIGRQVGTEQILVAYVLSPDELDTQALRQYCLNCLPAYLVPAHWERLHRMPLLPNFKVDFSALQRLDAQNAAVIPARPPMAFVSDPNQPVAWAKGVLKDAWCATGVGLAAAYEQNQSWRSGGGSSLEAVALLLTLEEAFGQRIPSEWIHGEMRPRCLEEQLLNGLPQISRLLPASSPRPVLYFFPAFHGLGPGSTELLRDLHPWAEVRLIQYPDLTNENPMAVNFDAHVDSMMAQIDLLPRAHLLVGLCSGTYAAHEVAHRLQSQGHSPPLLVLLDYHAPGHQPASQFATHGLAGLWRSIRTKSRYQILQAVGRRFVPGQVYRYLKQYQPQDLHRAHKVLPRVAKLTYLPQEVCLFRMHERGQPTDLGWNQYCASLRITSFDFNHTGMLSDSGNRQAIFEALLQIVQASSVGSD